MHALFTSFVCCPLDGDLHAAAQRVDLRVCTGHQRAVAARDPAGTAGQAAQSGPHIRHRLGLDRSDRGVKNLQRGTRRFCKMCAGFYSETGSILTWSVSLSVYGADPIAEGKLLISPFLR
jgi:hypothetical protein